MIELILNGHSDVIRNGSREEHTGRPSSLEDQSLELLSRLETYSWMGTSLLTSLSLHFHSLIALNADMSESIAQNERLLVATRFRFPAYISSLQPVRQGKEQGECGAKPSLHAALFTRSFRSCDQTLTD